MTCAKRHVWCEIEAHGRIFYGNNACDNPQRTCPREPGEGYEKCKSICRQRGHAEEVALAAAREAGVDLRHARAMVGGHYYVCKTCAGLLQAAGVAQISVMEHSEDPGQLGYI